MAIGINCKYFGMHLYDVNYFYWRDEFADDADWRDEFVDDADWRDEFADDANSIIYI